MAARDRGPSAPRFRHQNAVKIETAARRLLPLVRLQNVRRDPYMPKHLLLSLAIGCLMVACADHTSDQVVTQDLPPTPVNQPDSGATQPAEDAPRGLPDAPLPGGSGAVTKGSNGPGTGSGGEGNSGAVIDNRSQDEVEGGGMLPGGSEGGQPVPEPGTLLLVGSGLAAAALLRRRRRAGDPT